jgi:hypothetical protein
MIFFLRARWTKLVLEASFFYNKWLFGSIWTFFISRERLLQQNGDRRKRDPRENCTYHECSWKQDIIWLFASPLSPFDLIRGVSWSPATLSPPFSHLTPYPIGTIFNCLAISWGWPLIWRLWVWQLVLDSNSDHVRFFGSVIGHL